jgi:hypothetical protein
MPKFSTIATNGDSGLFASSVDGEGIHAESTSTDQAAVAAYQNNSGQGSHGAAIFGVSHSDGAAVAAYQRQRGMAMPSLASSSIRTARVRGSTPSIVATARPDSSRAT